MHFTSLIPQMSTFTLAISCLTTSNLTWFMDLTFQVPRQYCSLQHQTLLPSPGTSTTGCCFCFGSISSFFQELFLHWSPVGYWAPTNLGGSAFSVISFCLFILFMGFSRQEYWSGLPFPWREWQPIPVLLPGEPHGGRSLVGYSPWGRRESDTTERLHFHFSPVDHILSELSTMIRLSWLALHTVAHSYIELDKAVVHATRLVSFLWWWFSVCLPSDGEG